MNKFCNQIFREIMKRAAFILALAIISSSNVISEINIKGTIRNFDGKSPVLSYARALKNDKEIKYFDAGSTGAFDFTIPDNISISLSFGAVDCESKSIDLIIPSGKKSIEMNVTLKPLQTPDKNNAYNIIGQFNSFDFNKGYLPMQKNDNGIYTAELDWQSDTLLYQILKIDTVRGEARSFNGQQNNFYVYDGGGDYRSGITGKKGKYKIAFDPKKFDGFKEPDKIEFTDIVIKNYNKITKKSDYLYRKYLYERSKLFNIELPKISKDSLFRKAKTDYLDSSGKMLAEETDKFLRSYIILNYMNIATDGMSYLNVADKIDTNLVKELLKNTGPNSELWGLNYFAGQSVFCSMILNEFPGSKYLKEMLKSNQTANVHSSVYGNIITQLMFIKNEKEARKYLNEFIKRYPDDSYAISLKDRYFTVKNIKKGAPIPKFEVADIDIKGNKINNSTLKGKYVLLDFWSLGCGPCLAEMKNLDSAFKEYKDRNFTILSISIDNSPEPVMKYRSMNWKMPWLNTVIGGWKDKITRKFEVTGVPRPILIGPDGKVIALEGELRGKSLFRTLDKYLKN